MQCIEMFGLPGSGKTTSLKRLKKFFFNEGLICYDADEIKILYLLNKYKFLNLFPKDSFFLFKLSKKIYKLFKIKVKVLESFKKKEKIFYQKFELYINNMPISDNEKKHLIFLFLETIFIYELAKVTLKENEYLFMDEGYFHKLSTIFVSKEVFIDRSILNEWLFYFGKPNKVIHLNLDEKSSLGNILKRDDGIPKRMRAYSFNEQNQHMKNIKGLQEYFVNLSIKHNIEVIEYNIFKEINTCV